MFSAQSLLAGNGASVTCLRESREPITTLNLATYVTPLVVRNFWLWCKQYTQPQGLYANSIPCLTGIVQTVYSAPAIVQTVYSAPQASCKYVYSAPKVLCKQYTQPHRHHANSILSPTGIVQTVYSAPQTLCKQYIQPHRH